MGKGKNFHRPSILPSVFPTKKGIKKNKLNFISRRKSYEALLQMFLISG
jgi:hypothetical protein